MLFDAEAGPGPPSTALLSFGLHRGFSATEIVLAGDTSLSPLEDQATLRPSHREAAARIVAPSNHHRCSPLRLRRTRTCDSVR